MTKPAITADDIRALFQDLFIGSAGLPWHEDISGVDDLNFLLQSFEDDFAGVQWLASDVRPYVPDATSDGDDAVRALALRVIDAQNAVLDLAGKTDASPSGLSSPHDLAAQCLPSFDPGVANQPVQQKFAPYVRVDNFAPRAEDPLNNVIDVRDYGIGLSDEQLGARAFFVVRSYGENAWLIPTLDPGHTSIQHASMTLIASRRIGSPVVLFTVVRRDPNDAAAELQYLTLDNALPRAELPETTFASGTLFRHVRYGANLYNAFKERSVRGALDRTIVSPVFPIAVFHHDMVGGAKVSGKPSVGTVSTLNAESGPGKRHHRYDVVYFPEPDEMAQHDVGSVAITVYSMDPAEPIGDVLRRFVRTQQPILFTWHGQTLFAESASHISKHKRIACVVAIDCGRLTEAARRELLAPTSCVRREILRYLNEVVFRANRENLSRLSVGAGAAKPTAIHEISKASEGLLEDGLKTLHPRRRIIARVSRG